MIVGEYALKNGKIIPVKKYDDVLYVGKNNEILETSRRNIFIVDKNNVVKTPKKTFFPA